MFRKVLIAAVLVAGSVSANAGVVLEEGFDDVAGLGASGWVTRNDSTPGGVTGWFQGDNTSAFSASAGAANSYIAANFLNAGLGGNIDNWLITPLFKLEDTTKITFDTRTAGGLPGDTLEVLYSFGGTAATDFYSLGTGFLTSNLTDWSSFTLSGAAFANIRLAFRYLVTDTNNNGDYIGIDSFKVTVPEPSTIALFAAALLMMAFATRRRRNQF